MFVGSEKTSVILAKYLLNYTDGVFAAAKENTIDNDYSAYPYYSDSQIISEIEKTLHKVKPHAQNVFTVYQDFLQQHVQHYSILYDERESKSKLLEKYEVYDKNVLYVLKNFIIMTLALLIELERLHKNKILCGAVNPYTFLYNKAARICELRDMGVVFSSRNVTKIEQHVFGDYFYLNINVNEVPYTKYLAPELKEQIRIHFLYGRLHELFIECEARKLHIPQENEVKWLVQNYHQHKIRYTNRAEIYSVGFTLNQILSHILSKLAHFNLFQNEFPGFVVDPSIIHEAELLLPHKFYNPEDELVMGLLNEAVEYIYDLMHENMEKRDSLELSIEKFSSLLKRTSVTKPDSILEAVDAQMEHQEKQIVEENLEEMEAEVAELTEEAEADEERELAQEAEIETKDEEVEQKEEDIDETKEEIEDVENIEGEEIDEADELEDEAELVENDEIEEAGEFESETEDEVELDEDSEDNEEPEKTESEIEQEENTEENNNERDPEEQHESHTKHAEHDDESESEEYYDSHKQHGDSEHTNSNDAKNDGNEPSPPRSSHRFSH